LFFNPNNIYALKFIEMFAANSQPNQANQASAEYQLCRLQMSTWENPKKTINGGLFHMLKFDRSCFVDMWVESR